MPIIYDIHVHTTIQIMVMTKLKHNIVGLHIIMYILFLCYIRGLFDKFEELCCSFFIFHYFLPILTVVCINVIRIPCVKIKERS